MLILTQSKLKKIVYDIVYKENKKYLININSYPLTKKELMEKNKSDLIINPDKFPILKPLEILYSKYSAVNIGNRDANNQNIFIAIENYDNFLKIHSNKFLIDYYTSIYHEVRHSLQNLNIGVCSYLESIMNLENILIFFDYLYYVENKQNFLLELDADDYAYLNILEIFGENKYILNKINNLKYKLKQYDFDKNFDRLKILILKYPQLSKDNLVKIFYVEKGFISLDELVRKREFISLNKLFQIDIINYYINDYLDDYTKFYIVDLINNIDYNQMKKNRFGHLAKIKKILNVVNKRNYQKYK